MAADTFQSHIHCFKNLTLYNLKIVSLFVSPLLRFLLLHFYPAISKSSFSYINPIDIIYSVKSPILMLTPLSYIICTPVFICSIASCIVGSEGSIHDISSSDNPPTFLYNYHTAIYFLGVRRSIPIFFQPVKILITEIFSRCN